MKITSQITLLSLLGTTYGGSSNYPSVSIKVQDGSFGAFEGIDPTVSYSTGTSAMGCDLEAGATASIKPTRDIASLPRSLWGKISSDVAGWRVSSRVGITDDYTNPSIDLAASSDDLDASITIGELNKVELDKGFDALGGRISVTPRYNIQSSEAEVTIGYDSDDTTVKVDATSASTMKLTVSQQVAPGHRLTPSINCGGDVSVAWKKDLSNGDSVTTTVTPGDKVNVKWEDGEWVAQFDSALNGYKTEGLSVRVHRKVSFS
jgi:hypothetical protein